MKAQKKGFKRKTIVLLSCQTHYSVKKIASLMDLKIIIVKADKYAGMSIENLKEILSSLSDKQFLRFIVVVTFGTTCFGAFDNI